MEAEKKKRLSVVVREVIGTIPLSELPYAKPSRVLPGVEAAGFPITASVESTVSKLLKTAKEGNNPQVNPGKIVRLPVEQLPHRIAERTELAMKLVEACGGDFSLVMAEIYRLEKFAIAIKGA